MDETDIVWCSTDASVILFTENQVQCYLEALKDTNKNITFYKIKLSKKYKKLEILNSVELIKSIVDGRN